MSSAELRIADCGLRTAKRCLPLRIPHFALRVLLFAALLLSSVCTDVFAQAAWEYTPYQARVWIALEPATQLPESITVPLVTNLQSRCNAVWGGVMQTQVSVAPTKLRSAMLRNLEGVSAEAIVAAASHEDLDLDKIFLAAVSTRGRVLMVRVRELDMRTRQLGPVIERSCGSIGVLPLAIGDAVTESFTPLARIEQVDDRKIAVRLRAGGLAMDETSPVLVHAGNVLRPVIRRNDRTGQPAKNGILPIAWSYLAVNERQDSVLQCTLQSGYRSAIPAKGGVRMERLALLVKPRFEATRLSLRSRTDANKPLADYEVHRRWPDSEETELIGRTDDNGSITLPRGDGSLETLVVKNGKQLLARLPLVPGFEPSLTANVVDDDPRLAAEGFVAALQSRVLDLVARREILAARIRARLKDGKADEAQKLLEEFRKLDTRADLNRDLDRYRQQVSTADRVTEQRIEKVFTDAQRILLSKPLSDELLAQLTREVSSARAGGE